MGEKIIEGGVSSANRFLYQQLKYPKNGKYGKTKKHLMLGKGF
jgi:hypothetical protein